MDKKGRRTGPPATILAEMAYDSARQRSVFYYSQGTQNEAASTWEWDGESWRRFAGVSPPSRADAAITYDGNRRRVVLYGGTSFFWETGTTYLTDTWEFDGTAWTQAASAGPSARSHHAMAFDPATNRVVLFGGQYQMSSRTTLLGDTWEWDGQTWTQKATTGPPAAMTTP